MAISRNGRVKVYENETPWETDVLYTNMYNMMNSAYLAMATLGIGNSNATLVAGLPCVQNTVPDMSVLIGAGVMFNFQQLDATAYSSIPADTAATDRIYKPYIQYTQFNSADNTARGNLVGLPLTFSPPVSGATNYLLQATFLTVDTDSENREFYNEADPENPIIQNVTQTRWDTISYSLKSAVSPSIPAPDAGYVGLYIIAVASGATTITNGNISVYSSAPFITESLTKKVSYASLQASTPIYGADTGTANTYAVTTTPVYTAITSGSRISMKAMNANTGASTLNVSGIGAVAIRVATPIGLFPLAGGEILPNVIYEFRNDGTYWELLNPSINYALSSSVYLATNQTFPASSPSPGLKIALVPDVDPFALWDNSNKWFVIPRAGLWRFNSSVQFSGVVSNANAGRLATLVNHNGIVTELSIMGSGPYPAAGTADQSVTASVVLQLVAGDKIALHTVQNVTADNVIQTAAPQIGTYLQCQYIGN
jgi:hypothetical protein